MTEKELQMKQEEFWQKVSELPPEARREVFDFIALLQKRYGRLRRPKKTRSANLADEPFIGVWQTREDMADSIAWVRNVREMEWGRAR